MVHIPVLLSPCAFSIIPFIDLGTLFTTVSAILIERIPLPIRKSIHITLDFYL